MTDSSSSANGEPDNTEEISLGRPDEGLEVGDSWRSETVKKCPVCHTLSNQFVIGGYPTAGVRWYCPAGRGGGRKPSREQRHDKLEELLERRDDLEERLETYDTGTDAGERTRQRLHDELEVLDDQIRELRAWFDDRFDDVLGVDPSEAEVVVDGSK